MIKRQNAPIFIHSLPRVGSTWFGYKFADCLEVAYRFEPFHQNLISGTPKTLKKDYERLGRGKSLRHPVRANHYHRGYRFRSTGGVVHFQKRFCFANYCMDLTDDDEDFRKYVSSVITHASLHDRRPIIKSTNSAFRAAWLARHFPGIHIYLFRNPRLIDNSHFSFRGYSNQYIRDYSLIIGQNAKHQLFQEIATWSGLDRFFADSLSKEYSHYRRLLFQQDRRVYDRQYHFDCLCFFWVLALAMATTYADLIIDTDTLCCQETQLDVESQIKNATGLSLDLSDYKVSDVRLRKIIRRHRFVVSEEMETIIRRALGRLRPKWSKLQQFYLTAESKHIVRSFYLGKMLRSNCVDNSWGSDWRYVFSPK